MKFLFLPPEHDPDSFIREHGADAFAHRVTQATPLSRFLIDSAREGCDLSTAEGRAHLASNARPLWSALPDGALKRQLLGELADLVQLGTHELAQLWESASGPRAAASARHAASGLAGSTAAPGASGWGDGQRVRPRNDGSRYGAGGGGSLGASSSAPLRGRARPASRADHAARLLLCDHAALERLGSEDQVMLAALPAPHGPLLSWLEGQLHEHGPLPWAALREGLREHECEALALRVMQGFEGPVPGEPAAEDADGELEGLLNLMRLDWLKQQENEALAANDLARYREVHERRKALSTRTADRDAQA